jgi:hypothetical protein
MYSSETFRWGRYICEEVDVVLKAYLPILKGVYHKFSGRKAKPGQKPFMSLEEFTDLCNTAELLNERFTGRDVDT